MAIDKNFKVQSLRRFDERFAKLTLHVLTCPGDAPCAVEPLAIVTISFEIHKFEKLLERSIVRDRSIKFFPGPHWKRGKNFIGWVNTVNTTIGKAGLTPFLMEHLVRSGNQKKKTRFAGLFFLTGLRPVLLLGQCPPSKPHTL